MTSVKNPTTTDDAPEPDFSILYKYRHLDAEQRPRLQELLGDCRLYLSAPEQFNDPFDCDVTFSNTHTEAEGVKVFDRTLARREPLFSDQERHRRVKTFMADVESPADYNTRMRLETRPVTQKVGVFSLSRRADSPLMWAHYANMHKGFCIGFDRHAAPFEEAHEVVYFKDRRPINLFQKDLIENITNGFLQKSEDWQYEQEWRLTKPGQSKQKVQFRVGAIREVIFGSRMSSQHRDEIRSMAAKHRPKFYRAVVSDTHFRVELQPEPRGQRYKNAKPPV